MTCYLAPTLFIDCKSKVEVVYGAIQILIIQNSIVSVQQST